MLVGADQYYRLVQVQLNAERLLLLSQSWVGFLLNFLFIIMCFANYRSGGTLMTVKLAWPLVVKVNWAWPLVVKVNGRVKHS